VAKSLITHQIPLDPNSPAEAVLVSIKTAHKDSNIIVGSLYRPPSVTSEDYTTAMMGVVSQACRAKRDVVWLGGDLNLPDIDWDTNSTDGHQYTKATNKAYLDKFHDAGLMQTSFEPTRGNAILDVFLTNQPSLLNRITTIPGLSDHDILQADNNIQTARVEPTPRVIHLWNKANTAAMKKDIKAFTTELLSSNPEPSDVQGTWNRIHKALLKSLDDHVPSKSCSTTRSDQALSQRYGDMPPSSQSSRRGTGTTQPTTGPFPSHPYVARCANTSNAVPLQPIWTQTISWTTPITASGSNGHVRPSYF